ncbi:MAG: HEPN domain-containing protein [Bacteroidota bacterium]
MKEANSLELSKYRLKKANETLLEIDILVQNELWNTAVNRMYYACYYAVSALLIMDSIQVQTHTGVRQMFGLHYIKAGKIEKDLGKFYSDIFDKRQTGDYDDFMDFTGDEVRELLSPTRNLIDRINQILRKQLF